LRTILRAVKAYTYIGIGYQDSAVSKYYVKSEYSQNLNAKPASSVRSDIDLINEGIVRVLRTAAYNDETKTGGERVGELDFGSRIHELPFEPNDSTLVEQAKRYVTDALQQWEPRIQFNVTVEQDIDNHMLKATILYAVLLNQIETGKVVVFLQ
jgi:phage baseplate assembly protein W